MWYVVRSARSLFPCSVIYSPTCKGAVTTEFEPSQLRHQSIPSMMRYELSCRSPSIWYEPLHTRAPAVETTTVQPQAQDIARLDTVWTSADVQPNTVEGKKAAHICIYGQQCSYCTQVPATRLDCLVRSSAAWSAVTSIPACCVYVLFTFLASHKTAAFPHAGHVHAHVP